MHFTIDRLSAKEIWEEFLLLGDEDRREALRQHASKIAAALKEIRGTTEVKP